MIYRRSRDHRHRSAARRLTRMDSGSCALFAMALFACTDSGVVGHLCGDAPCDPSGTPSMPVVDAAPGAPDDLGDEVECTVEFAVCVLRSSPQVESCIEKFSTCEVIVDSAAAADAGVLPTCTLQLSACTLREPNNVQMCLDAYADCNR